MPLPRLATLTAALSLATFGFSSVCLAAPTRYPLTLENCGMPLTFAQAPSRAVTRSGRRTRRRISGG